MNLFEILVLAIILGIDCLVVSFSQGLMLKSNKLKNSILLGISMGGFQGLFPCFGYLATGFIETFIEPFSHIIVFTIFFILGIKFIKEAFEQEKNELCCINLKCLITMGIATSIDAFASGITLQLTDTSLFLSALLIGFVSFLMSLSGFWFGNFFEKLPSKYLQIVAGLILIFMAFKAYM